MAVSSKLFALLLSTSVIVGCDVVKVPDLKTPEFKAPEVKLDAQTEKLLSELYVCDKKDSELGLDKMDLKEALIVKDTIESKKAVYVDCAGKRTSAGIASVRKLNQLITVEAPVELKEKVNFVKIDNARTCATQKIDAKDDAFLSEQTIEVAGQEPVKRPGPTFSTVGFSGKMKIRLSDTDAKISSIYLNVHDKNNLLKISYYGKCLKYKADANEKLGDAYNCLEADLLGEAQLLVSVQVERPEVAGTIEKSTCTK